MAELQVIDEIVEELHKIRGVDLPKICLKMIVLSYMMYCANTFDFKYKNEDGQEIRLNSGCIILCQKGSGKSRTLRALKQIFVCVDEERIARYNRALSLHSKFLAKSEIPLTDSQKKEVELAYQELGREPITTFDDPITSKGLCETYAQIKKYYTNNLLFTVDEAGDRLFRDAFSANPSISAKEFVAAINQLFDGYCGMGKSKTSRAEGITSQYDVGANFIFVSTAEFLKDWQVQQRYQSSFEGGIARRLLYINCPPIDKLHTNRKRYHPNFDRFIPLAKQVFTQHRNQHGIPASEALWGILEQQGAGCNITIDDEFLLLLFCTVLAVWTNDLEIQPYHWQYMVNTYKEMKALSLDVIKDNTSSYEKICVFMREYAEQKSKSKGKVPLIEIKDYCVRERMISEARFKKWFNEICEEFVKTNSGKYIIEKNQMYAWLTENFAYNG